MSILTAIFLTLAAQFVDAISPLPLECNATANTCWVFNSYGIWPDRRPCYAAQAFYPVTEAELLDVVAYGAKNKMKMKAISSFSHSIPKLVCPGGKRGIVISTRDYTRNIIVDTAAKTVAADSGVQLQDLFDEVGKNGLAFPASPYWNGLSVGGVLSTGSHGSCGLNAESSAMHDYIISLRLVVPASAQEGYSKVIILNQTHDELNAAKVSLGVLGVISQVTFSLQPLFKRSVSNVVSIDTDLEEKILPFAQTQDYGDITWYPAKYLVVYREDKRVPVNEIGNGVNKYIGFQPISKATIEIQRTLEDLYEESHSETARCAASKIQIGLIQALGTGLKNNNESFRGYPVVGYQHKIQTAGGCQNSKSQVCAWDRTIKGLFYHESGVSIATSKIKDFISDVKRLRDLNPSSFCAIDLYAGILLRFVPKSSAYLGKPYDTVDIGFTYYRAHDAKKPRLSEDIWEEIEQMALFKYQGLPHWGKNRNIAFLSMNQKYPGLTSFLAAKNKFDPEELFSSEWSDAVLQGNENLVIVKDHCALEGLCICSEDDHCAPEKNYFCRAGKVFPAARVCRHEPLNNNNMRQGLRGSFSVRTYRVH